MQKRKCRALNKRDNQIKTTGVTCPIRGFCNHSSFPALEERNTDDASASWGLGSTTPVCSTRRSPSEGVLQPFLFPSARRAQHKRCVSIVGLGSTTPGCSTGRSPPEGSCSPSFLPTPSPQKTGHFVQTSLQISDKRTKKTKTNTRQNPFYHRITPPCIMAPNLL